MKYIFLFLVWLLFAFIDVLWNFKFTGVPYREFVRKINPPKKKFWEGDPSMQEMFPKTKPK